VILFLITSMSESYFVLVKLEDLQRSFDQSFADAPHQLAEQVESLLCIRIAGDAYAVRLSETSGIYVNRRVVGLPSPVPELLGMAGFRGSVIPVFDLGAFLGYGLAGDAGRWLLLVGMNEIVGLAFQEFDGHLRMRTSDLACQTTREPMRQHVREVVSVGGIIRPIINLASVVQAVKRRVAAVGSPEGA
jgi:purine-binding chemotaxis protein CheW